MRRTAGPYLCSVWFAGSVLQYLPRKYGWPTHLEFYIKYLSMHDCEFDSNVWFNENIRSRTGQSCDSKVGTNIQFYCPFQHVSFLRQLMNEELPINPWLFTFHLFKSDADNISILLWNRWNKNRLIFTTKCCRLLDYEEHFQICHWSEAEVPASKSEAISIYSEY